MTAKPNIKRSRWENELDKMVTRQHILGAWVAVILDPLWFISDYFIIPSYWKIFFVIRILVSIATLSGILLRKKLNLSNAVIIFIPFLGIALQNAYMYSVMDVATLQKHTFAYIALFIGAGMFVIWKPVYSIIVIILSLIGNIILFHLFSKLTTEEALINGGLLTATVAIFSIVLSHTRYHLFKKEIIARLQLEDTNEKVLQQNKIIEKSVSELGNINKKLSRFAYVISHDLKAPLRGVKNLIAWIEEDAKEKLNKQTLDYMNKVNDQIDKMNNLINGVLEYSKAGIANKSKEWINLHHLLKELTETLFINCNVHIHVSPGLPKIYHNKISIVQVFQNLLSNAVKHNDKQNAEIKIFHIEGNGFYEFSVEDNGPGIAPEDHERVFELFQTLHVINDAGNTGVGLPIVKQIIEESGGKIWIESMPGNGAVFKFTLPKDSKELFENSANPIVNYSFEKKAF